MSTKFFDKIDFFAMKNEFVGTLAIVYCAGWAWMNFTFKNCTILEVGATDFLVYSLFVWAGFTFSGGHYNPALTLWTMFLRRVEIPSGIMYIVSQCLASLVGASLIKLMSPDVKAGVIKSNKFIGFIDHYGDGGLTKWIVIIVYEAIGSLFIILVYYMMIFGKEKKRSRVQGIYIFFGIYLMI